MSQQANPTPSLAAQQQLQGILVELADIERRLHRVNRAVASIASELAPSGQVEADTQPDDEQSSVLAALVKPRSPIVVQTLVEANQRAEQMRQLSPSEFKALMAESMQQALAAAQSKDIAIDDDAEAALGD